MIKHEKRSHLEFLPAHRSEITGSLITKVSSVIRTTKNKL